MKKLSPLLFILLLAFSTRTSAQGSDCSSANAFCTGSTYTFPATTGVPDAQTGPDYGCLGSEPNPAWYYLQVGSNGDIVININSADASGSENDVDFICYGPFTSLGSACSGLTGDCNGPGDNALSGNYGCSGNIVDCSYSASASETCGIPGAVAGQWYMLMLTNYADVPSDITFSQSNSGAGAGSTNCDILCSMTSLTALAGGCNASNNTFPLLGTVNYTDAPSTGSLVVTDNCTGQQQVFTAPFATGSTNYMISGLPANGASCTVTAIFTADSTCTFTSTYNAPPPCSVTCSISGIAFTPTTCNSATQQYDINSGSVTFTNAPTTGTLTITNSCGGTPVVLNAPFTSPAAFSFAGLSANSASCSITAVFSANSACTYTQTYTAPAPCPVTCAITALTATPTACNSATQQYDVSGSATFVNAPSTGTLTITNSCGGTPVVLNAPFTSPASYSFTGLNSNGNACTVSAVFSANASCTATQAYTAPAPCSVSCSISALTTTPSACDPSTNNYSVSGSISFVNAPSTGTLTVTNSCGGSSQTFNAPFTGPLAYALNGLTSDGATCTVTATFSADPGCTATRTYAAPASCSLCPVTATNGGPVCQGDTIRLHATTVVGGTYSWTGPMGFTSTLQNPVIANATLAMEGNYVVSTAVPATPTSAACSSSSTTAVVVNANPVVTVNTPVTCEGVSTTLTATGAATYLWNNGATTPTITVPGTAAPYGVIGYSAAGCVDTAYTAVITTPVPTVSFTSSVQNGCNPVFVQFTADGTGNTGASYDWNFGDGTTGTGISTSHLYEADGCHTVHLTVSYSAQCSATDSIPCMVQVYPQPDAGFYVTPSNIDILNPNAQFVNTSTHSTVWMWNFGDGSGSFDQNPAHTYAALGTYPVTVYASGAGNCIDSATNYVVINDISTIYVPNAFTPNADGNNDVFNISSHGVSADDFELLIFDRWGNRILKTNDLHEGWNGGMNNHGSVIAQDVYVYKITYKDLDGRGHKLIGHVTLVN